MCILLPLWRSEQMEKHSGSNGFQRRCPVESRSIHQPAWQSKEEEEDQKGRLDVEEEDNKKIYSKQVPNL